MKNKYHYDIKQGTSEWDAIRRGKITASVSHTLLLIGDKINASLVGLAENIRIIMRHLSVKLN